MLQSAVPVQFYNMDGTGTQLNEVGKGQNF